MGKKHLGHLLWITSNQFLFFANHQLPTDGRRLSSGSVETAGKKELNEERPLSISPPLENIELASYFWNYPTNRHPPPKITRKIPSLLHLRTKSLSLIFQYLHKESTLTSIPILDLAIQRIEEIPVFEPIIYVNLFPHLDFSSGYQESLLVGNYLDPSVMGHPLMPRKGPHLSIVIIDSSPVQLGLPSNDIIGPWCSPSRNHTEVLIDLRHLILIPKLTIHTIPCMHYRTDVFSYTLTTLDSATSEKALTRIGKPGFRDLHFK